MRRSFLKSELEKVLAQDYEHTWASARIAINRYMHEAHQPFGPWWWVYAGNKHTVAEFIDGTKRYWLPTKSYSADSRAYNNQIRERVEARK